jgi:hypothetical protein
MAGFKQLVYHLHNKGILTIDFIMKNSMSNLEES